MKKKILLVGNTSWSMFNFRNGLIKKILSSGFDVCVLAPYDSFSDKLIDMGCSYHNIRLSSDSINPFKEISSIKNIYSIIKSESPDFIISYTIKPNIYTSFISRLLRINQLCVTTGLGHTFNKKSVVSTIIKILYKISFKHPVEVWFLNNDDRQSFIEENLICSEKAILLYGEGIDTAHYSPSENPENKQNKNISLLLAARMLWEKGIGEFIEAARYFKDKNEEISFQLIGACDVDNPNSITRHQIMNWVEEGIIEYLGTTDDIRPYINSADCIVLPSFYREGIPRILMEAASMEKPIITTNNVGCKDVVKNEITGFLCEPKDTESLISCIKKFINLTPTERQILGRSGRQFIESTFDEKLILKQYMQIINKHCG
ncbi:glycosyltransferase family 4 protein [Morganella morganii]|nr:glycosyltransferase family 4 protein [Morganella morganii]